MIGRPLGSSRGRSCRVALTACDLLAISIRRGPNNAPKTPKLEQEEVKEDLLTIAKSLVSRARETSELAELWAEADDAEWQGVLDDLIIRLTPSIPYEPPQKKRDRFPDDFLGHCYICYGMVTERDGLYFEQEDEGFGASAVHPHRKCSEERIPEPGPYWHPDGSPTECTKKQLRRDMGYDT